MSESIALKQLRHRRNQENYDSSSQDSVQNSNSVDSNRNPQKDPRMHAARLNSQGKLKSFACKRCVFNAATREEYWKHKREHIPPNQLKVCPKCPFVADSNYHLDYHIGSYHTGEKPVKCSRCDYTCINKSMLRSHKKVHSETPEYRCKTCKYESKYCTKIKQHLQKSGHKLAVRLYADGTESSTEIGAYDTKRPKLMPKKDIYNTDDDRTLSPALDSNCTTTDMRTLMSDAEESNSNHRRQSASKLPEELPSTLAQALVSMASEVDWQSTEGAVDAAANLVESNLSDDEVELLEGSTAENSAIVSRDERLEQLTGSGNMPLDLTVGSARDEATTNYQPPYQQAPLNLTYLPRVGRTKRRKGITVQFEYRIVNEEEDTDEEVVLGEKRFCQSASPTAASDLSISSMAASTVTIPEDNVCCPTEPNERCDERLVHSQLLTDEDHYLCEHCDISYPDRKILHAHMRYHSRVEPFTCEMCSMPYGNREEFNLHIYEMRCTSEKVG